LQMGPMVARADMVVVDARVEMIQLLV
jgi:hypothetical protein